MNYILEKSQDFDIFVELPNVSKPPNKFTLLQLVTEFETFGEIVHPIVLVIELVNSDTTCTVDPFVNKIKLKAIKHVNN